MVYGPPTVDAAKSIVPEADGEPSVKIIPGAAVYVPPPVPVTVGPGFTSPLQKAAAE